MRNYNGSAPLTEDTRDFNHQAVFGATPLANFNPSGRGTVPFPPNNQEQYSYCTGCAVSEAAGYQDAAAYSFEYQIAKIGEISGFPITNGADPRKAMQSGVLYGSLPRALAPMSIDGAATAVVDWNNWPSALDEAAAQHERQSYFRVDTGDYDAFDNIRSALATSPHDVAMAFTPWYAEWENVPGGIIPSGHTLVGWHAHLFIDWKTINGVLYLVQQNSWGVNWGDGGLSYWSRDIVNATLGVSGAGAYMFVKMDPNVVKRFQLHNVALSDIFAELRARFGSIITQLFAKRN